MNLSEIFIRRPIATSLLMAAIALFGIVAYRTLPVSDLPSVDFPTLNVNANLPGADPNTMASSVATVLERQFTTIAGLDSMTSSSGTGQTQITLQFSLDRDIDSAAVDVQTAIAEVTPLLPPGMPSPPSFKKNNPADQPIMQLTLTSPTLPMSQLDDYAENLIMPRMAMINGVSQVQVQGQQKYAVRVQVDPDKLVSKRIGLNEVDAAIANWNPNLPTGTLFGPQQSYTLTTNAELKNAAQFGNVIVSWRNGAPVRLGEVADVIDSVQDTRQAAWMYNSDGQQRSIQLQVMRQPGANTIAVTDNIRQVLPQLAAQIPPSANVRVRFDRSKNIRESFKDIQVTMLITLVLVIGVIFVFLRNASATIIPSMALPFALLGTFAMMAVLGYSLDQLSLMALILSIGFVVDDAIVMLENIMRHIEHGEEPYEAALKGSKEIGFTIISMTVSLAAVFIPVLFMGGILGRLFREFAVTITTAILVSGVVSITLTPMLCSRFLKVRPPGTEPLWSRGAEWVFQKTLNAYEWSLRGVLRWRPLMLLVFFAVLGLTWNLFQRVNTGFIPDTDQDTLQVSMRAAQGTSFGKLVEYQKRLADIIRKDPNVEGFLANVSNGNYNQMQITLKPRKQRPLSAQQLVDKLRPQLSNFAGFQVSMNLPPSLRIGGRQSNANYQFTLQGTDTDELFKWAQVMEDELAKLPQVNDVNTDLQNKNPLMTVKIDRERAALYGLNAKQIENALYSAYGPETASKHLHLREPVPGAGGDEAQISGVDRIPFEDLLQGRKRATGAAGFPCEGYADRGPAEHRAFRGTALGHPVFQSEDRREPGHGRVGGDRSGGAGASAEHNRGVFGQRADVPSFHAESDAAADRGDRRGVHRAGRAVRELHPPDHDSFGAAFGRRGRAADADPVQGRAQYLFLCRPGDAGGYREEERHHADRLRPGGGAQTRQEPGRRDL